MEDSPIYKSKKTDNAFTRLYNRLIKESGLKVDFIRDKIGLSRPTYYKCLADPKLFTIEQLMIIASLLNRTLSEFVSAIEEVYDNK